MRLLPLSLLVLGACAGEPQDVRRPGPGTGPVEETEEPATTPEPTEPGTTLPTDLESFVGSPCATDADCHESGVCMLDVEGFPGGMCTEPCDTTCPDANGFPTTFCASVARMPDVAADLADGLCTSRCDFSAFPGTGCREGYGCAVSDRFGDAGVEGYACLPDLESELTDCLQDLVDRGIGFETAVVADSSPSDHPELTCHVEDPVKVHNPVLGVTIGFNVDDPLPPLLACNAAHALVDTVEDVKPDGVTGISHMGTYVCRTIAGTDTLSRHSFGDAIDIAGFQLADGTEWTVLDHWEDGDPSPETDAGIFLYDAVHRWDDLDIWNILLTPEYNDAHDNHFHVDLTPGSDFLGLRGRIAPRAVVIEGPEPAPEPAVGAP